MKSPDYHIHYGTRQTPNPYEADMSPEEDKVRQERIDELVDHLLSGKCKPSDLLQEDCFDLVDQIVSMLANTSIDHYASDIESDIETLCREYSTRSATWLIDQGNTTVSLAIKEKLGL